MNRLSVLVLGLLFALASGAWAGEGHRCAKGTHWDPVARECVSDR